MAFIRDWENEIKDQSLSDLKTYAGAVRVLQSWPMFRSEFKGTKIELLRQIIDCEIELREWEQEENHE
ncbi:MAG: hypothetical protein KAT70_00080 [Thermoplasmata archaeon]|nr:hypothetical protein [Thermoplasmata archaeon]